MGTASLASSVHLVCDHENMKVGRRAKTPLAIGATCCRSLPRRIHEWMPRLADGRRRWGGRDLRVSWAPALEIFSRYSRVEKASRARLSASRSTWSRSGPPLRRRRSLMIFTGADATGFEEDARLTAMWLWTLSDCRIQGENGGTAADEQPERTRGGRERNRQGQGRRVSRSSTTPRGRSPRALARHLEQLTSLIEVKGSTARLLPVAGTNAIALSQGEAADADRPRQVKKKSAPAVQGFVADLEEAEDASGGWGETGAPHKGETVLDRVHQSMILFGAGARRSAQAVSWSTTGSAATTASGGLPRLSPRSTPPPPTRSAGSTACSRARRVSGSDSWTPSLSAGSVHSWRR